MGREVRRVPTGWNHPAEYVNGLRGKELRYVPLLDGSYKEAAAEYAEEKAKWERGEFPKYASEESRKMTYAEWNGEPPQENQYMPDFPEGTATMFMMYEDTSEGTPISPAFATPKELARWLSDSGASAFGDMTATYEQWLPTCRGAWVPWLGVHRQSVLRLDIPGLGDRAVHGDPLAGNCKGGGVMAVLIYFGMIMFDAFVLAGTAYLVQTSGWSAWWFLFAAIMCAGSNPKNVIRAAQGLPDSN